MAIINVTNRLGEPYILEGREGATVMEVLRDNGVDVEAFCGGCCSCATCHVFVGEAWRDQIPAPSQDEQELLQNSKYYRSTESRLSCQVEITETLGGIVLVVAPAE
jgi:2Fe-2S ferredoxin